MTCAPSVGLGLPLPGPPNRFRLPLPALSAGHAPVVPSPAAACAATSMLFCNCPIPAPSAGPGRWLRSSGSPANTWPGTNPPKACACPGRSCQPLPRSGDHTADIASAPTAPARSECPRNEGSESPPATSYGTGNPCRPVRLQSQPRIRSDSADIPPPRHTTYWGYLSQVNTHLEPFTATLQ